MGVENLAKRPPRVTLTDVDTGRDCTAQFNPEELKERLRVNYKDLEVPGLPHKPRQYLNTDNWSSSFTLGFDELSEYDGSPTGARRFLMSLCYPRQSAQDVVTGAPPRVLFSWPNLLSLTCVVDELDFTHRRFNSTMKSVLWSVEVKVTETRLVRLYSEDVLRYGTLRS